MSPATASSELPDHRAALLRFALAIIKSSSGRARALKHLATPGFAKLMESTFSRGPMPHGWTAQAAKQGGQ
jgi:hypothetical protein